jgi:hypothetical protein
VSCFCRHRLIASRTVLLKAAQGLAALWPMQDLCPRVLPQAQLFNNGPLTVVPTPLAAKRHASLSRVPTAPFHDELGRQEPSAPTVCSDIGERGRHPCKAQRLPQRLARSNLHELPTEGGYRAEHGYNQDESGVFLRQMSTHTWATGKSACRKKDKQRATLSCNNESILRVSSEHGVLFSVDRVLFDVRDAGRFQNQG